MTSIQPDVPEEELSSEPEDTEEMQPEDTQRQPRARDEEGVGSGPIIINR